MRYCLKQPGHKGSRGSQQSAIPCPQMCGTAGGGLRRPVCISAFPRGWARLWCISSASAAVPSLEVPAFARCGTNPKDWFRIPVRFLTRFQHPEQTAKWWCMSKLPMGRDGSSRRRKKNTVPHYPESSLSIKCSCQIVLRHVCPFLSRSLHLVANLYSLTGVNLYAYWEGGC